MVDTAGGGFRQQPVTHRGVCVRGWAKVDDDVDDEILKKNWFICRTGGGVAKKQRKKYVLCNATVNGRHTTIHLAKMIMGPIPDGKMIDHIDGNTLDYRRKNLRFVTGQQNSLNRRCSRGSGGVVGVSRSSGSRRSPWAARLTVGGKEMASYFKTRREACLARDEMVRRYAPKGSALILGPKLVTD